MSIPDDGLPCLTLEDPQDVPQLLLQLQGAVMKHPLAAQALFSALIAEGRAFERTAEGQVLRERLKGSDLLHRARLALDLPGLSLLTRAPEGALPSGYVDALFMMAGARQPGEIMDALFKWRPHD
jgi:hypothetical protein